MVMVKISFGQQSSCGNAYDHIYKHVSIEESNPLNCTTLQYGVIKEYLLNIKHFWYFVKNSSTPCCAVTIIVIHK